ncbi:MAG: hypothetical protein VKS61_15440 [Candidatus Sericytochromatia bacterium]|nr:hypothetical protein [Candidatus Sericytochromatia bacterium]
MKLRATSPILGTLVLALGLTACGNAPTAPRPARTATAALPQGAQPVQMPPVAGGAPQDPQAIRALVAAAHARAPGLDATIETYDKGPRGQETNIVKLIYKKPQTMRVEMVKATGVTQGARILWTGTETLRIKPTFLPMAVEKRIDDEQTVSKNGWTIRHTGVHALFKVLLDPAAQVRHAGSLMVDGRPLEALEVRSAESPSGITHEVIGIDPVKQLPVMRAIYRGQQLLYRATLKQMTVRAVSQGELSL